jgi:hypothetical protein
MAKANNLENAVAGRWKYDRSGQWRTEAVAEGFSAFDGKRGRHEVLFSLKDLAEKRTWTSADRFDSYINSSRDLTDGVVNLFDMIAADKNGKLLTHTSQINSGKEAFHEKVVLPLDLGRLPGREGDRLSDDIQVVAERRPGYAMEVHEGVRLFDRDLIELTFTDSTTSLGATTRRYWVDLEQGAITRQRQKTYKASDGSYYTDTYVQDDIRQVGDSAWFPYRLVRYNERTGMGYELAITEADFTNVPAQSTFRLEFDKPRGMWDNARDVVYPPQKVWDLDNLPAPEVSPDQPAPWTSAPAAPMPGERQATPRWWTFAAIGIGVVLLTLAGRSFQRNRRDA